MVAVAFNRRVLRNFDKDKRLMNKERWVVCARSLLTLWAVTKKGNLSVHQSQKRLKNSSQTKIFLVWPSPTNLRFLLFNKLCSFFVTFISFRLLLEYRPLWVFANSVRFPNLPSFFFHLSRAI